jgi:hypothetical protein
MKKSSLAISFLAVIGIVGLSVPPACQLLPIANKERVILKRASGNLVTFQIRGNWTCLITTEGSFPEWYQDALLNFVDASSFFKFQKTRFRAPEDFTSNQITSGEIELDQAKNTATVSLKFDSTYWFSEPANGVYDLAHVKNVP